MKSISDLFIQRPVMTILVMLAILIFGVTSYRSLPVSDLPNVDFPTIEVSASLPGASPETMASAVATVLEKRFSTIAGIDSMSSTSSIGRTTITLQFALERDIDAAAQDVQAAISVAQRRLPDDMTEPPSFRKINPADLPILYAALTSATLPLSTLNEYGETFLAQRLSMVSGVAQVMVYGAQKYALRIHLDPDSLVDKDISLDEVEQAVTRANVNLPVGRLEGPQEAYTLQTDGQVKDPEGYRGLVVAYRNGIPVRLGELAEIVPSVENDKVAAWFVDHQGSRRAIVLAVQRQPGTNTVAVARAVRAMLDTLAPQLPGSVSLEVFFDRSESIRESARDVQFTLLLTLALVVLVIFLFLRNLSATIIPSLALPMSIIGTFVVMYLLGYSLNNLSLMALTLSVGFVVDDAIVMLENIVRHMEKGEGALAAARQGAREIGFTILSMTISLAAVFLPVLFMGGILGRLFHEFAVTIGAAILISGFVSLSLTPMLCSRFLRPPAQVHHGRLYAISERWFQKSIDVYAAGLRWSLNHRRTVMVFSALVLAAAAVLFVRIPKGFLPSEDTGQVMIYTQATEGISFAAMIRHQQTVAEIVRQDPDVAAFMSNAGARGASGTSNTGSVFMRLKPRAERTASADEIITRLRPQIAQVPGVLAFLQNPPPIRLGARSSRGQYQVTLTGGEAADLYRVAPQLEQRLRALDGIQDVSSDLEMKNPQVNVFIDRDKAAALGISARKIEETLYRAYGAKEISTIYESTDTYAVIMALAPRHQVDPSVLSKIYLRSENGTLVPLATLARMERSLGLLTVNHTGQQVSVTLSFNLEEGYPLGRAVEQIQAASADLLPAGMAARFQGTAQAFQDSMTGLGLLLLLAVLVIYMVLGILYESFIHPLTILSALPFAGFGALVTLMAFDMELSLYAFVGVIMLVGLVKKNGIMMIDFAIEAQQTQGLDPRQAIYDACLVRFRPIMMTTMSALMGTIPIAVGLGAGAEARQPLGLAVVGGLIFSQFLTMFVTPVFYLYMEGLRRRLKRWFPRLAASAAPRDAS
jgi:HAE1 family hydrophobic/amphiphilic exporter-1